jgi:hypothetical protein
MKSTSVTFGIAVGHIAIFGYGIGTVPAGEGICYAFAMTEQARWAFTSALIRALFFQRSTRRSRIAGSAGAMAQSLWMCCDFSVTIADLTRAT